MSSSAESPSAATELGAEPPLDWYAFSGREVPGGAGEFVSPESELISAARRSAEELRAARAEGLAAAGEVRETLFDLAVFVSRLDQLVGRAEEPLRAQGGGKLYQQLRILKNQMLEVVTGGGIELRDPTGLPAAEVLDWVNVNAWLHRPEYEAEVVARTEECAVFHGGRAVRLARVQMGAPVEAGLDQGTDKDKDEDKDREGV
ncbi:hypothetical protein [Actinospica sp.]|jgi:hypothetical protein|uniref:hypothetical protein n=1 Tax=Actinospica sp. TaxID=1872142 RepID=UPI002C0DD281|nr:hypothetical protein [Actinospica sp.]HWG24796.1 hypothetical protein [Actinospica sp.]